MSQDPDPEEATPHSLNENVQIIHQGAYPPESADKYLTKTYSGSPRGYDSRAGVAVAIE